ncbi:MAG: FliH/SctL family protein, partial [Planctomycetota bacterium]
MGRIIRTSESQGPSLGEQHQAQQVDSPAEESARILALARNQAREILENAEKTSVDMISMAERRAEEMLVDSQARIQQEFQREVEAGRTLLNRCAHVADQAQSSIAIHHDDRLLEVALAIAGRVVRRPSFQPSDLAVNLVREAVEMIVETRTIKVYVSPVDFERHATRIERMVGELRPRCQTTILSDERMTVGDCRIETDFGTIDQTLDS